MASFEAEYKKLNKAQKQAVDAIDGPVLVIAGPGTGKTQLLGARVANILKKTDAYPDNILCLTFTNKAADNMLRRLLELIGQDANFVAVKTFHGLAADIMNRHPEYFWRGARLSIAPDAVQLQVMHSILSRLPAENPLALRFAGQLTMVDDATKAVGLVKEAGLTPDKLKAIISANLAYIDEIEPELSKIGEFRVSQKAVAQIDKIVGRLPVQSIDELIKPLVSLDTVIKQSFENALQEATESGKNAPISKWKARWIQKSENKYGMFRERQRNEWWLSVAMVYELYRQQLHSKGYYDYADMLVEVISQIEQHEDLRAALQEQYQYVLIDEFQDTNAAQLRLAHLIADHAQLEQPNILAVGDDDQSIFKFQGAELSNMLGFTRQYDKAKLIVLSDNYRSTQEVLNNAEQIITNSRYRLVKQLPNLTKNLKAVNAPSTTSYVEHRAYRSREEQLSSLALEAGRQFRLGNSVAVLARSHSSLRDIAKLLQINGTPLSYEQSNNILELPAIEQLCIVLKIAAYIKKGRFSEVNELLSLTLRTPMWNIKTKDLWGFAISQQKSSDWFKGLLETKNKQLNQAGLWLDELAGLSSEEPLAVVMEYAIGLRDFNGLKSPIKKYYLSGEVDSAFIELLSAIKLLRSIVDELRIVGSSKLEDFVSFIDLMTLNDKVISDDSPFVNGDKFVEVLSVHKAKGLEFDTVIVVDGIDKEWSPRVRGRVPPANLPLRPAEDDADDYARLMYVAATRAKHTAIFGSYTTSEKGDQLLPAKALQNIKPALQKPQRGKKLADTLEQSLRWPVLEQKDEKSLLKPRLESYSLNVSNLINFLDVTKGGPQYFKERNLLRLPEAKTPSASFGSAIHAALEEAQLLYNTDRYSLKAVQAEFEQALLNEGLPEADYRRRLADGKRLLTSFLSRGSWKFNKGALPEYKVIDAKLGSARLGGTFDVLFNTANETLISDYKTGRPLRSLNAGSGQEGLKAWRHKLQMMFYALLVDIDPSVKIKGEVICEMIYVEAAKKAELKREYRPVSDDITRLGSLVSAVWEHIIKLDFPDIKKYPQNLEGIKAFEKDLLAKKI